MFSKSAESPPSSNDLRGTLSPAKQSRRIGCIAYLFGALGLLAIILTLAPPPAERTGKAVKNAPATVEQAPKLDLIPGTNLRFFTSEEVSQKRAACVSGVVDACDELCLRHLNGNRPGFPCPPEKEAKGPWLFGKQALDQRVFACENKDDEDFALNLDGDYGDEALAKWIKHDQKHCIILSRRTPVTVIREGGDGFIFVHIEGDKAKGRWVEGIFIRPADSPSLN